MGLCTGYRPLLFLGVKQDRPAMDSFRCPVLLVPRHFLDSIGGLTYQPT